MLDYFQSDRRPIVIVFQLLLSPLFAGLSSHEVIKCTRGSEHVLYLGYVQNTLPDKQSAFIHLVCVGIFSSSTDVPVK